MRADRYHAETNGRLVSFTYNGIHKFLNRDLSAEVFDDVRVQLLPGMQSGEPKLRVHVQHKNGNVFKSHCARGSVVLKSDLS